jgi:pre-mRNA-splicing factor CDC5/CEF1
MEDLIKMGLAGERASAMTGNEDSTLGFTGNYSAIMGNTPIRTPRAAPEEDHIANEIRNIRALTETQSSLLGGDNAALHEGSSSTGFDGITPRRQDIVTPNPMATPFRQANGMGATPGPGATPLRTPRDHFSLNRETMGVGSTPRDIKNHENFMRQQLRSKLSSLPKPKRSEWQIDEIPDETAELPSMEISEEDAAERDRREKEAEEQAAKVEFKRQSQVYQRGLPRPAVLDLNALMQRASKVSGTIEGLIANEAAILIAHDSRKFPVPGAQVEGKAPKLRQFDDRFLNAARASIAAEITSTEAQKSEWQEKFDDGWSSVRANSLPGLENYEDDEQDASQEEQKLIGAFDTVQNALIATAERGNKIEKKLSLHYGGYLNRAKTLRSKILEAGAALPTATNELDAFRTLQISEETAVPRRLESLREAVSFVMRREREAQELYRSRKEELDELVAGTAAVNGWH